MEALAGQLNPVRQHVVEKLYSMFPQQDETISAEDVASAFNAEQHPKVLSGDASAVETRQQFLRCLQSLRKHSFSLPTAYHRVCRSHVMIFGA